MDSNQGPSCCKETSILFIKNENWNTSVGYNWDLNKQQKNAIRAQNQHEKNKNTAIKLYNVNRHVSKNQKTWHGALFVFSFHNTGLNTFCLTTIATYLITTNNLYQPDVMQQDFPAVWSGISTVPNCYVVTYFRVKWQTGCRGGS